MSIVVTGATGHLGRRTVESLLERGVDPAEIVATGRSVEKLADLAERGRPRRDGSTSTTSPSPCRGWVPATSSSSSRAARSAGGCRSTPPSSSSPSAPASPPRLHERPGRRRHHARPRARARRHRGSDPRERTAVHLPAQRLVHRELRADLRPGARDRRRRGQRRRRPVRERAALRLRRGGGRRARPPTATTAPSTSSRATPPGTSTSSRPSPRDGARPRGDLPAADPRASTSQRCWGRSRRGHRRLRGRPRPERRRGSARRHHRRARQAPRPPHRPARGDGRAPGPESSSVSR